MTGAVSGAGKAGGAGREVGGRVEACSRGRYRARMALFAVAPVVLCGLLMGVQNGWERAWGGALVGVAASGAIMAFAIPANRRMARRLGSTPRELVTHRQWIRKERVPDDPEQQRVMAGLVAQQQRTIERNYGARWLHPFLAVMLVGLGILDLVRGSSSVAWAVVLMALGLMQFVQYPWLLRRTRARLDRMSRRLPGA